MPVTILTPNKATLERPLLADLAGLYPPGPIVTVDGGDTVAVTFPTWDTPTGDAIAKVSHTLDALPPMVWPASAGSAQAVDYASVAMSAFGGDAGAQQQIADLLAQLAGS